MLRWHFAQLRAAGEHTVFAPYPGGDATRSNRQAWLRNALRAAIPVRERRARAMVAEVTPHSFRPGLASDLLAQNMSLAAIAVQCRWQGVRNVRMYAERSPLGDVLSSRSFRGIPAAMPLA